MNLDKKPEIGRIAVYHWNGSPCFYICLSVKRNNPNRTSCRQKYLLMNCDGKIHWLGKKDFYNLLRWV